MPAAGCVRLKTEIELSILASLFVLPPPVVAVVEDAPDVDAGEMPGAEAGERTGVTGAEEG